MPKVGIIGTGWGARVQVPAFREAGLEVTAIAGHDPEKTARIARELDLMAHEDWRQLLTSDVELVTIVTPPATHLELATAALQAGKHVVSEKPTAMNAAEAQQLLDAARRRPEQIAIVDHELRFLPAWRAARERVGEIGAIRYAEVRYASPSRGDRSRAWNWWSDAAQGGGIWGAVGSHFIDALRFLGLEIDAVNALLHTVVTERDGRPVTSDDFASVHLRFTNGAVGAMTFSAVAGGADEPSVLTLHGEEGALRLTGEELQLARRNAAFERVAGGEMERRPGNSPGGPFGSGTVALARALRAALQGDRAALGVAATFEDGLAQQRVLDAARRSHASGGWERV